ncbi:MAG TPA: type II toxin-antitoxin system VapC family toxin [Nevskiaceae bacterium]|nr:type II toxin-antitoxin system VapC family toxin [Nevskiaceae bacterium]
MTITPDTNVLVRVLVRDDGRQAAAAERVLSSAEQIALTLPSLCELVWVLMRHYDISREDTAATLRALMAVESVTVDRHAVDFGLSVLEQGGDFADGVIAYEGQRLGGMVFVSFDRQAVKQVRAAGGQARAP